MADHFPGQYPEKQQPTASSQCITTTMVPMYAHTRTILVPVTTSYVLQPEVQYHSTTLARASYVFSVVTLMFAVLCLVPLICSLPAFVLSYFALFGTGNKEKRFARISIGLNVAAIIIMIMIIAASIAVPILSSSTGARASYSSYSRRYSTYRSCPSYYSSTYNTYCTAYSYYTTSSSCRYYSRYRYSHLRRYSRGRYCPN